MHGCHPRNLRPTGCARGPRARGDHTLTEETLEPPDGMDLMRVHRLNPSELLRATGALAIEHWRPLLLISLATFGLTVARYEIDREVVRKAGLAVRQSYWFVLANMPLGFASDWLEGIGWMAIGLAALTALRRETPNASSALRESFGMGRRWIAVMLLLEIVGALQSGVLLAVTLAIPAEALQRVHDLSPWLSAFDVPRMTRVVIRSGLGLVFLWVTFAPLALALEGTSATEAFRVSWRRVRGNWWWLCGGTIAFDLLDRGVRWALGLLPKGPAWIAFNAAAWVVVLMFVKTGSALQYINLMVHEPSPARARIHATTVDT
jgi:hypothetical protein